MRARERAPRYPVDVGPKMYFGHALTMQWCHAVASIARTRPALTGRAAELFVIPSHLSIPVAREILGGLAMGGPQDLSTEDSGALTGEVSGSQIAEVGCRVVEVGHAERRRLFGDTGEVVRAKTAAALRNGVLPLLCVGEAAKGGPTDAARECIGQIEDAVASARAAGHRGRIVVAYEPCWAIGAEAPASPGHTRAVYSVLRVHARALPESPNSAVVYGGSAGPGLLTTIGDTVDRIFLGRFGHDPAATAEVLDEVQELHESSIRYL